LHGEGIGMKDDHNSCTTHTSWARGVQALGVSSFTALGFILGGVVGGVIEGDLLGVLHFGVPAALIALVFVRAVATRAGTDGKRLSGGHHATGDDSLGDDGPRGRVGNGPVSRPGRATQGR
jgi:hypothetical protein